MYESLCHGFLNACSVAARKHILSASGSCSRTSRAASDMRSGNGLPSLKNGLKSCEQ